MFYNGDSCNHNCIFPLFYFILFLESSIFSLSCNNPKYNYVIRLPSQHQFYHIPSFIVVSIFVTNVLFGLKMAFLRLQ